MGTKPRIAGVATALVLVTAQAAIATPRQVVRPVEPCEAKDTVRRALRGMNAAYHRTGLPLRPGGRLTARLESCGRGTLVVTVIHPGTGTVLAKGRKQMIGTRPQNVIAWTTPAGARLGKRVESHGGGRLHLRFRAQYTPTA